MGYNVNVYMRQGDGAHVVGNGGKIVVQTGGKIVPNSETQASHVANVTGGLQTSAAGNGQVKINAILAALRGVGILATS